MGLGPALAQAGGKDIRQLIVGYLQGSGIPCPELFAGVKPAVSPLVDLSQADNPAFRPRTFAWAAAGSPYIDPNTDTITVSL